MYQSIKITNIADPKTSTKLSTKAETFQPY